MKQCMHVSMCPPSAVFHGEHACQQNYEQAERPVHCGKESLKGLEKAVGVARVIRQGAKRCKSQLEPGQRARSGPLQLSHQSKEMLQGQKEIRTCAQTGELQCCSQMRG